MANYFLNIWGDEMLNRQFDIMGRYIELPGLICRGGNFTMKLNLVKVYQQRNLNNKMN